MEGRDISEFISEKKIEIRSSGSGIQSVSLEMRRRVNHNIAVLVPAGTLFVARSGYTQNMVTRSQSRVELVNDEWTTIIIDAACANMSRSVPDDTDTFSIRPPRPDSDLQQLMAFLGDASVPYEVEQAAIWIVTDNADFDDLGILRGSGWSGLDFQVIGEEEAAQAMKIVEDAGINITRKAIWRDRKSIAAGLPDGESKTWLQEHSAR